MKKDKCDPYLNEISNGIIVVCLIGLATFGMIMLSILGIHF